MQSPDDASFAEFRTGMAATIAAQLGGNVEPFIQLWSTAPDVMIFGGLGGYERGAAEVADRLRWAAARVDARLLRIENLMAEVRGDTAITADLEHMIRRLDGRDITRALRVTHGYRVEAGRWRIFYRHADEYRASGR